MLGFSNADQPGWYFRPIESDDFEEVAAWMAEEFLDKERLRKEFLNGLKIETSLYSQQKEITKSTRPYISHLGLLNGRRMLHVQGNPVNDGVGYLLRMTRNPLLDQRQPEWAAALVQVTDYFFNDLSAGVLRIKDYSGSIDESILSREDLESFSLDPSGALNCTRADFFAWKRKANH